MATWLRLKKPLSGALGLANLSFTAPPIRNTLALRRPPTSPILRRLQVRPFSHGLPRQRDWHRHNPEEQLRNARPLVTNGGMGRFFRSPSTHTVAGLAFLAALAFYFTNIQTVPVSGRRRFNCYSEASVEAVSEQQVKRIIDDVERQGGRFLGDWDPRTIMVKRVMRRLIPVSGMEDSNWEVRVIDDPRMQPWFEFLRGKKLLLTLDYM
jgi:hypothetical protein